MDKSVQITLCIPCIGLSDSLYRTLKSIEKTADMPYKLCLYVAKESCSWNRISCLKTITTPYIVWIDDDIEFTTNDWLSKLIKHFEDDKVGMVGCYIMHYATMHNSPKRPDGLVPDVCGAVMAQRRVDFRLVFPDIQYLGGQWEDTDLCYQMNKAGYKIVQDNSIPVIHYTENKAQLFGENMEKFKRKWSL